MADPRIDRLADVLVGHSLDVQPDERVLIEGYDLPDPALVVALVKKVTARGGRALVDWKVQRVLREVIRSNTAEGLAWVGDVEKYRMERVDCYLGVRGAENNFELGDVPKDQMGLYQEKWYKPVHFDVRVPKTRWCVLRYPTAGMAQAAEMSQEQFEEFFFDVCTADYAAMKEHQQPLADLMRRTDRVHIKGPGTDLQFSIKDVGVVPCYGTHNIPDGEVFTAPVKTSVEGTIRFNAPTIYQGVGFDDISLTFKGGKVTDAKAGANTARLQQILATDEGAAYVGEWSLGLNNAVTRPMRDILFDEKIGGSFHLTPGNAYDEADNGNRSQIHWDMVCLQRPESGGGEVHFDGVLLRQDGHFRPADLQSLNAGL